MVQYSTAKDNLPSGSCPSPPLAKTVPEMTWSNTWQGISLYSAIKIVLKRLFAHHRLII
jgi:hypothetical protein